MKILSLYFLAFATFMGTVNASAIGLEEPTDCKAFRDSIKEGDRPVLINFGGSWCPPCQKLKDKLKVVAEEDVIHRYAYIEISGNPGCADFVKTYCMDAWPFTTVIDDAGLKRIAKVVPKIIADVNSRSSEFPDQDDRDAEIKRLLLVTYNLRSDLDAHGADDVGKVGNFGSEDIEPLFANYKKQWIKPRAE